jgi:hypothetical protein
MSTKKPLQADEQDFATLLNAPRIPRQNQDRRHRIEEGPPWVTEEGFVLEDRRSGEERRQKKAP